MHHALMQNLPVTMRHLWICVIFLSRLLLRTKRNQLAHNGVEMHLIIADQGLKHYFVQGHDLRLGQVSPI